MGGWEPLFAIIPNMNLQMFYFDINTNENGEKGLGHNFHHPPKTYEMVKPIFHSALQCHTFYPSTHRFICWIAFSQHINVANCELQDSIAV